MINNFLYSAIRDFLIIWESLRIAFNRCDLWEYGIKRFSAFNFIKMTKWYFCSHLRNNLSNCFFQFQDFLFVDYNFSVSDQNLLTSYTSEKKGGEIIDLVKMTWI